VEAWGGRIQIGDRFRLASRPVTSHLVTGPRGVLEIGHDVSIAHGAAIAAFQSVRIGDGTCMGPFAVIMDTNFHRAPGDQSVQHECRPVLIGGGCRIGSRVTITRGAIIGDGAEILAGSVVSSVISTGVCAGGVSARILGRVGEVGSRWDGAAAQLPELVREALGREVPPDLESSPSSILGWDGRGVQRLLALVENRFGVSLDLTGVSVARSLADVAAAVERARDLHQTPGGRGQLDHSDPPGGSDGPS